MPFIYDRLNLKGKVAIVTGAGQGIGKAIALGLAEVGARVVIAEIREETGPVAEQDLRAAGSDALFVKTDARDPAQVNAMVRAAMDRWGRVDIMCNNAGGTFFLPALDLSPNGFDAIIRQNLKSMFLCSQAAAKAMIQGGRGGSIISTASVAALQGGFDRPGYAAAKAGIIGLTKELAVEWGHHGIRVNAVAPGGVNTSGNRSSGTDRDWSFLPIPRMAEPQDIASAVVFLASDLAAYITGETLIVDGGATIRGPSAAPAAPRG